MAKVVIIGIDGLDPQLIKTWRAELPHFQKMLEQGEDIETVSTFPPDSICAWASIFTGENPAEHGLIESIDYLASKSSIQSKDRSAAFRGKTFWDIASSHGKKVCVINPFLAYPAWEVNGIMVSGPVFEGGEASAFPASVLQEIPFPPLGGMADFPKEKELGDFITRTLEVTRQQAEAGLKVYRQQKADLFFLTFLTLDRIKHFLWRYTDDKDPYFVPNSPHKDAIKLFYKLFDTIIGDFMQEMGDATVMLVFGDHGHRRRCSRSLNLNEWLRKKGYIATSGKGISRLAKELTERLKVLVLSTLAHWGKEDWIYRIAKLVPNRKALKKSTYLIDKAGSKVMLANICGANPHGGVDVRIEDKSEYERTREQVIREMLGVNEAVGKKIVLWAKKREEVYKGRNIDRLPDVVFELDEDYGVGMDFYVPLVTANYNHRKISGGHKSEGAFLAYEYSGRPDFVRPRSVIDIYQTVLGLLGIRSSSE